MGHGANSVQAHHLSFILRAEVGPGTFVRAALHRRLDQVLLARG